MSQSIYNALKRFWRALTGAPEPEPDRYYFRTLEDVEIAIDWAKKRYDIVGTKVERATDEQAFWIRHLVRAQRAQGTVRNIDD